MNTSFRFKQFTIRQEHTPMKVGTDGVLLGAWADVANARRILDIGTGTGLIALMAAQRNATAQIDAVEIDTKAYNEALYNVSQSPWKERIHLFHTSIRNFAPAEKYDAIICNPPFFVQSTQTPDAGRNTARHCDEFSHNDLLRIAEQLLTPEGKLSVILPIAESGRLMTERTTDKLFLRKNTSVCPTPEKAPKRHLLEFSPLPGKTEKTELIIELNRHVYSEKYIDLTREFYLYM